MRFLFSDLSSCGAMWVSVMDETALRNRRGHPPSNCIASHKWLSSKGYALRGTLSHGPSARLHPHHNLPHKSHKECR